MGAETTVTLPADYPVDNYTIGDPGRAADSIGVGIPSGVTGWPDTAVDAAEAAGLQLRAASVRGVAHRRFGAPRQDSYSIAWQQDTQTLVITVCDGVGAFDRSHEAADLAAVRLPALLDGGWQQAFEAISAEIDRHSEATDADMATTVVAARITAADGDRYRAELAWVGDSAAYLLGPAGWRCVAGAVKTLADDGAPLSSATAALPVCTPVIGTAEIEFSADSALFLMSDGVADPLGSGAGEVGQSLAQWWAQPPNEFRFAAQVGFARRSFDDDRTVVGVWPHVPSDAR